MIQFSTWEANRTQNEVAKSVTLSSIRQFIYLINENSWC